MPPKTLPVVLCCAALAAQRPTEELLPASPGWLARRIHRSEHGTWYAQVANLVPAHAAPDVVTTDDGGNVIVLSGYSGRWTSRSVVPDRQWLALSQPADVDPRVPGRELYVAGKAGNVHRVTLRSQPFGQFALDSTELGHVAAEEFHCVLAADLVPARPGDELLVFGISGRVFELRPDGTGDAFAMRQVALLPGRARDAVLLPPRDGEPPKFLAACRSGHLLLCQLTAEGLEHRVVAQETSGLGRLAVRRLADGSTAVYATRDDGVLLRFQADGGSFRREAIFAGSQGLRGVAAARLHADGREAIAVYGYDGRVQVVARVAGGPWQVETIFAGPDAGHWLCAGELDGRNGTEELIATGFGGQVVLLSRVPGHALSGAAVDAEDARPATGQPATDKRAIEKPAAPDPGPRPWRIAVRAGDEALRELSPLNYQGGFETKTLIYETLVRRGADARLQPGLASAFRFEDGGRVHVLTLREGATFHDGAPVRASDVAVHFRRWFGLPEHDWLSSNARIRRVAASGERELRVELDRPWALLPDLCAINPTAIRGPSALDREGRFVRPVGSGPFRFVAVREDGRVLRLAAHRDGPPHAIDLVRLGDGEDPLAALLAGDVDAVVSGWLVRVDPARVVALRSDPRFMVTDGPGSSTALLRFSAEGVSADPALRRRVAAAIDRAALIAQLEHGLADACLGAMAPGIAGWPPGRDAAATAVAAPAATGAPLPPLRLGVARDDARLQALGAAVAAQLAARGLPTEVVPRGSAFDLRLELTHGVPYDPDLTALSWFRMPPQGPTAATPRFLPVPPRLGELGERLAATPAESEREAICAAMQQQIDADCILVPLYAARRIAVVRAGMPLPRLEPDMYRLDAAWLAALPPRAP